MITTLLTETCTILRRQEDTRDEYNKYSYYEIDDVPCIGLRIFENTSVNEFTRNLNRDLVIFTKEQIFDSDKIVYEDYEYEIEPGGVSVRKSFISGDEEFYATTLQRREEHPSEGKTITRITTAGGRQ